MIEVVSALLRTEDVPLSDVHWPQGLDGLDEGTIAGIMDAISRGGVVPPIQVTDSHYGIFGRHRFVAHGRLGLTRIRCDVVSYPSADVQEAHTLLENLRRVIPSREDRDLMLARLVELFEKQSRVDPQNAENLRAGSKTKPKSAHREAIRETAARTNLSEDTVERAVKAQEKPQETTKSPKPQPIEKRIQSLSDRVRGLVEPAQELYKEALGVQNQARTTSPYLRDLERAAAALVNSTTAFSAALEAISRGRANVRRADRPGCVGKVSGCIREAGHPGKCELVREGDAVKGPGTKLVRPPSTGLGGRKLDERSDDQ